jgi:hypothetical protein
MTKTFETGFGDVTLTDVILEDNFNNLCEGIDVSLYGESIGELHGYSTDDFDDEDIRTIEDFVAIFL